MTKSVIMVFGVGTSLVTNVPLHRCADCLKAVCEDACELTTLCEPETVLKNDFWVFRQTKVALNP